MRNAKTDINSTGADCSAKLPPSLQLPRYRRPILFLYFHTFFYTHILPLQCFSASCSFFCSHQQTSSSCSNSIIKTKWRHRQLMLPEARPHETDQITISHYYVSSRSTTNPIVLTAISEVLNNCASSLHRPIISNAITHLLLSTTTSTNTPFIVLPVSINYVFIQVRHRLLQKNTI